MSKTSRTEPAPSGADEGAAPATETKEPADAAPSGGKRHRLRKMLVWGVLLAGLASAIRKARAGRSPAAEDA